jgi:hypothetical protein
MNQPQDSSITYKYDRQHLYVTSTISLSGRDGRIIGTRKQVDTYDKEAAEDIIRQLNEDKTHWEQELKKIRDQLDQYQPGDAEIDEDFIKKVGMALNASNIKGLQIKKENTEKVVKDINWQLGQVKKAMNIA